MKLCMVAKQRGWNFSQMQWLWKTCLQQGNLNACRHGLHITRHWYTNPSTRSSKDIRTIFLDFFRDHGHQYVHSSSVIPRKGAGTYFVNAGMNQFKSIFLGTVEPGSELENYRRVTNCQKCIRVGGKHNDLEEVGRDTYHHTFFEMLGSWSFGDYWKSEACKMAWELLTKVYGISEKNLYVTYFSDADSPQKLESDAEVKNIWRSIGIAEDRLLPGNVKDNFWDMGETGPCGPCTEIHYDFLGRENAAHLVNAGDPSVVELWNLVFTQYDRQIDGSLVKLPRKHVDTGMGLERLTAVLQGKQSNYDTDLFTPIFSHLHKSLNIPRYDGKFGSADIGGRDMAYRIIADHTRMMTVCIADGLRPGRSNLDSKLRDVMHRCFRQAQVLGVPTGFIGGELIPLVIESLESAYPEVAVNPSQITDIINLTEDKYLNLCSVAHRLVQKATDSQTKTLSGEAILQLTQGEFGQHVPLEVIEDVAKSQGLQLDIDAFQTIREKQEVEDVDEGLPQNKVIHNVLSSADVQRLRQLGVPTTEDSSKYQYRISDDGSYEFTSISGQVMAILCKGQFVNQVREGDTAGVILDRTCMYAEGGGQAADQGLLMGSSRAEGLSIDIQDVQSTQNYVLHTGVVRSGSLHVNDTVEVSINQDARIGCMQNHTGTHILSYALNKVLGSLWQKGSSILPEKFNFDFSCSKALVTLEDIAEIERVANDIIDRNLRVYRQNILLNKARNIAGLRLLPNEEYPSKVCVVSVGVPVDDLLTNSTTQQGLEYSVELCGGTHVTWSGDIKSLVIKSLQGGAQGTKRVTALTGQAAVEALKNAADVKSNLEKLRNLIRKQERKEEWDELTVLITQSLYHHSNLPKVVRDEVQTLLEHLMDKKAKQQISASKKDVQAQKLLKVLKNEKQDNPIVMVYDYTKIAPKRDIMDILAYLDYPRPVLLLCPPRKKSSKSRGGGKSPKNDSSLTMEGFAYVPPTLSEKLNVKLWAEHLCRCVEGRSWIPHGGKHASPPVRFCNVELNVEQGTDSVENAVLESASFALEKLENSYHTQRNK